MFGKSLDFSLEDIVFILASRLLNAVTNLQKFGPTRDGYNFGYTSFIRFF
jgi:hypothetical protein